jgi:hypothetical protein
MFMNGGFASVTIAQLIRLQRIQKSDFRGPTLKNVRLDLYLL